MPERARECQRGLESAREESRFSKRTKKGWKGFEMDREGWRVMEGAGWRVMEGAGECQKKAREC